MVEDERFEVRDPGCNSPHGFDWENGISIEECLIFEMIN